MTVFVGLEHVVRHFVKLVAKPGQSNVVPSCHAPFLRNLIVRAEMLEFVRKADNLVTWARMSTARQNLSENFAHLFKIEPFELAIHLRNVGVANVADKVRLNSCAAKKQFVDHCVVETRNCAAIETDGAGGNDEISTLQ